MNFLGKVVFTAIRWSLRPVQKIMIKNCLQYINNQNLAFRYFVRFGQFSNRFEVKINRKLLRLKGLGHIPPLDEKEAFEKGVEWSTEIFFFYGTITVLAWYELSRQEQVR